MPQDRLFRFIANLIAIEAVKGDWESNFTDSVMRIREMTSPGLMLLASINIPGQSIPRRFIYWGLVRMMDNFSRVRTSVYEQSWYPMYWRGEYAGGFAISFGEYDDQEVNKLLNITANDIAQAKEIQIPSVTRVGQVVRGPVPGLEFSHEFYGSAMPAKDLGMSVIGALVQAAELPYGQNISTFGGGFLPRYEVLQAVWSAVSPSPASSLSGPPKLDRNILTGVLADALIQAQLQNDPRQIRVLVRDQGRIVVEGGDFPLPENVGNPGAGVDVA
ncbi:MAG: hypothetical protein Q9212_002020 [Teloschistes hypoglaucus]